MTAPDHEIDALLQAAWTMQSSGRPDEAIPLYRQILARMDHVSAWLGLGQCQLDLKQPDAALAALRRAAALRPDSGAIRHMIDMLAGERVPDRAPDDYVLWVFDGHADSFDAHLTALGYRGPQMIARLAERAWPREATRTMLDLGCGTGLNAPVFRPYARLLDGVDLAPRMLNQASRRGYDRLFKAEAHAFLRQPPQRYDVILSTDVFIYIGRLDEFFMLSNQSLVEGGTILCTIELGTGDQDVQLMPTGRFRQTDAYIHAAAERAGFAIADWLDDTLRVEQGQAEPGRAYRIVKAS